MVGWRIRVPAVAVLACLLGPSAAAAQASPSPRSNAPFCFFPRPIQRCASFLITEMSLEGAVFSTRALPEEPDFDWLIVWTVGAMVNRDPRSAFGAAATLRIPEGPLWGFEGRYRRWLSRRVAVDFMAGFAQAEALPDTDAPGRGLTVSMAVTAWDLIGAQVRGQWLRAGGEPLRGLFVGARVGSYVTALASAALLGLVVLAVSGSD